MSHAIPFLTISRTVMYIALESTVSLQLNFELPPGE